jgi:hypothetical protein
MNIMNRRGRDMHILATQRSFSVDMCNKVGGHEVNSGDVMRFQHRCDTSCEKDNERNRYLVWDKYLVNFWGNDMLKL